MAIGILQEIREAENTAEGIRKQALSKAKDIVKDASEEADRTISAATRKSQEAASRVMREMETGANEQARLIVEQGMERCEAIKSISQDKLNRAVSLVVERIVNPYGNS